MESDPYYKKCARQEVFHDHECHGRITYEHAMIFAGRQVQEKWAIIPLCEYAHFSILDKEKSRCIALNRATDDDLRRYFKSNWIQEQSYLNQKFGLSTGSPHAST